MPSKKIIITAIAALTLSLATACAVFSEDSNATENGTRTSASDKDANVPANNTVIQLTGEENGRLVTNEEFEWLRKNITDAKNSEESPRATHEPTTPKRTRSEDQRWCQAWALDNLKPHIYAEFAKLDPDTMDDLDRTVWRARLEENSPRGNRPFSPNSVTYDYQYSDSSTHPSNWATMVGTCWMYWSEELSKANADRRNAQFEAECKRKLMDRAGAGWDYPLSDAVRSDHHYAYVIPNQYVRVLKWLDIPGKELLAMDEPPYEILKHISDMEYAYDQSIPSKERVAQLAEQHGADFDADWWHLVGATLAHRGSGSEPCQLYYPQLFYGYWVPITEPYADPINDLSAEEVAEIERLAASPMYLPKP